MTTYLVLMLMVMVYFARKAHDDSASFTILTNVITQIQVQKFTFSLIMFRVTIADFDFFTLKILFYNCKSLKTVQLVNMIKEYLQIQSKNNSYDHRCARIFFRGQGVKFFEKKIKGEVVELGLKQREVRFSRRSGSTRGEVKVKLF